MRAARAGLTVRVARFAALVRERQVVPSPVRFDKLAMLDRSVIAGKVGAAPADWLHMLRLVFFDIFGFGQPATV